MSRRFSDSQMSSFFPALVLIGSFVLIMALLLPEPVAPLLRATSTPPPAATLLPTNPPPAAAAAVFDAALVTQGQGIFQATCSACHGLNARGIPGLGKDLVESQFVHGQTDEALTQFIVTGRDSSDPLNTTGIPMPPRGGNPSLTDDQLLAVVAYLRSESASTDEQAAAVVQAAPTATPAVPLAAPILPTTIPITPQPFTPQTAYLWSCAGCHGADGTGNDPFAQGFIESELLTHQAALRAFLTEGRPLADPRIEYPHPPRGGYPALTDEQLAALTEYVVQMRAP